MLTRRFASVCSCANGSAQRVCTVRRFGYPVFAMDERFRTQGTIVANEFIGDLGSDGFPGAHGWSIANPIRFATDWQGKNEDSARETQVRALWNTQSLFLKFDCRYRTLTIFESSDASGRRDQLWDRDVAEVFIQTDPHQPRRYLEFEVSPNGMWIDLLISPEGKSDPQSGMKSRVVIHESEKLWTALLALPIDSLVRHFAPDLEWRVNFFRVEGTAEARFYSSWRPTYTPQPDFHVSEAFGLLRFQRA
jgi:alpha-galactosidase